jgi:hypothetical protein
MEVREIDTLLFPGYSHYKFETIRAKALMAQFVEDKPKIIKDDFDF